MWKVLKDPAVRHRPYVIEHADGRLLRGYARTGNGPVRRWKHFLVAQIVADCENRKDATLGVAKAVKETPEPWTNWYRTSALRQTASTRNWIKRTS